MKYKILCIFAFGAILSVSSIADAQTQDKSYYTMERIKMNNPWSTSHNAAGLIFNQAEDYSVVEGKFAYEEGNYRNVSDPSALSLASLYTESFRKLKNVYFYGKFDFGYSNRRNMGWCSMINPYDSPISVADSTPGSQRLETYRLSGAVGYPLGKHFAIGGRFNYEVANNAKRKDARNQNKYMNMHVYPGVMYHSKHLRVGVNFIYEKMTELVNITVVGVGTTHVLHDFDGMWFYTSTMLSSGDVKDRDYKNEILGGALQLELYGDKIRFFNQLVVTQRHQEVFRSTSGDERNGEMKERIYKYTGSLNKTGEKYSHYLSLAADFTTQLGLDNIQQQQIVDGKKVWVQYGTKNKTTFDYINADVHYTIFRNRSAYNSSWNAVVGAKFFSLERKYRMYPLEFSQEMRNVEGYLAFAKNFEFKKGMLDCGLNGSYTQGDGTLFEQKVLSSADAPDFSKYKQREDMRYLEYEYLTADKFSAGFSARYTYFLNKDKGMSLYANAKVDYRKAVNGHYDGKERTSCEFRFGFAF